MVNVRENIFPSSMPGVQPISKHTKHTDIYEKRFSTPIESQGHFF